MTRDHRFQSLLNALRDQIQNSLVPGEKLPAESRLATMHGVGATTVHRALLELKDQGYVQSIRRVGWRRSGADTAKSPPPKREKIKVGLMTRRITDEWHKCDIYQALQDEGKRRRMEVVPLPNPHSNRYTLDRNRIELSRVPWNSFDVGLLVEAEHTIRLGDPLLRAHPVLAVDQDATAYGINSVAFGNTQAGAMVAQHLLELGHRRFAITDDFIDAGYPSDPAKLARRHGFEAAIGEAGGVLLPEWRLPAPRRGSASLRHQLVKKTVAAWAAAPQNKRPTALFAFDHLPMTQGKLVEELARSGLQVPGDLSIVAATWAGSFFGGVAPETGGVRFSSIDFDLDGLVRKVFEAVAELAQADWAEYSRRPPKVFVVPAMFIRGRSTAPPKALSKL